MNTEGKKLPLGKVLAVLLWALIIILLVIYRERINIDSFRSLLPESIFLSFLIMLGVFAFKSITVVIYSGLLYTVSGLLFSMPVALLLNFTGSIVMCSIPYLMAYPRGYLVVNKLNSKYSRLAEAVSLRGDNDFIYTILLRLNKVLPFDLVSSYLGAQRINFFSYICGSMVELSFSIILFTIAGRNLMKKSTTFTILTLLFQAVLTLISFLLLKKFGNKKNKDGK